MQHGVLLLNLGSPDKPTASGIRRFLRAFLNDARVLSVPAWFRWALLNLIILPFRPYRLVHAYQSIWMDGGSPLRVYARDLSEELKRQLPAHMVIEVAMQHGEPTWQAALARLSAAGIGRLSILPLYPQYASATSGAALEAILGAIKQQAVIPELRVISDFYIDPDYIQVLSLHIRSYLPERAHLLFSYHGLPQRDIEKIESMPDPCKQGAPCPAMSMQNRFCYRAQCYATTNALAQALDLQSTAYSTSFQSRLGRIPWIKPYTDEALVALRAQGIVHLAVVTPSFVMDCLETLEEIGIRAREQWLALGGESFVQIPCLNSSPDWAAALLKIVDK